MKSITSIYLRPVAANARREPMNALFAALAIAAVLTVALVLATPSAASERAPGCPDGVAIGNLTLAEPRVLVGIGDSNARLADRDGLVCSATLVLDNPNLIPR
jgi:hypothetical protein